MLDIKRIREHADAIKARLALRGAGDELAIDQILALDEERRKAITEVEQLKSQRNAASKEIGALMGQKKVAEADARKAEVRQIGDRITELDKVVAKPRAESETGSGAGQPWRFSFLLHLLIRILLERGLFPDGSMEGSLIDMVAGSCAR